MKNVKVIVKLRRLTKSIAVVYFILLMFVAGSAFTVSADNDGEKKPLRDSSQTDKSGFKSLFSVSYFDPAKPYITQLNPHAVSFVQNYIQEEGANLQRMKIWGKPYFDMYDGILSQYGLPKELKYLSVIESSLISNSISSAGAVGPWQIMADEAKRFGLRMGRRDERKDFYKSTHAAAKILKELHSQFNDWLLVIAAYNCGAGRVRQAMKKSGSNDFWNLQAYLPAETRGHVKRFIGTHYIFEGNGGLTTMTASEILDFDQNAAQANKSQSAEDEGNRIIEVTGKYRSTIIARKLGIDLLVFNRLNPNFDKKVATGQSYNMRLPADKIILFGENKNAILNESIQLMLGM